LTASQLSNDNVEAEVIDLRSIQPWDEELVVESLSRTHRLMVAHEAVEAFGVGAEIVARMAEIGFDELDAPIIRVGSPFMPIPFAKSLELECRPDSNRLVSAAKKLLV
jgi:pyruvate dehydrogenase E1 component beta subunit